MDEPRKLSDLIAAYMERAREQTKVSTCPAHGGNQNPIYCSPCAADRLTEGPEVRAEWAKTAAMAKCDELFPRRYRDAQPDHPEVLRWVEMVAKDIESAPSLLLYGPTGTGKTHQGYAGLRAAILAQPKSAWATSTFPDFAAALRPRKDSDSEAEMSRYRSVDLLMIDDIGTAKGSEWVEEITYRLINGRYEDMRLSVFTTNLTLPELKDAIGDRIASRLAETCILVSLEGTDRRRGRAA